MFSAVHKLSKLAAILTGILVLPSSALAQDGSDDWDIGRDADKGIVLAAVSFENFGIAVRCRDNILSVVASGLPVREGEQKLDYSMGGGPTRETTWIGARRGGAAFAIWPASIGAELRRGGRLSLGVPDGERVKRIIVDIPPSASAIGQVFSACGRELPEEALNEPVGDDLGPLVWRHMPQPSFPSRTASEAGIAALECDVSASGGLRRCRIESEFPEGGGFGRAATLGAHQSGRVALPEGQTGDLTGRHIAFVVRYALSSDLSPTTASRLPARNTD